MTFQTSCWSGGPAQKYFHKRESIFGSIFVNVYFVGESFRGVQKMVILWPQRNDRQNGMMGKHP